MFAKFGERSTHVRDALLMHCSQRSRSVECCEVSHNIGQFYRTVKHFGGFLRKPLATIHNSAPWGLRLYKATPLRNNADKVPASAGRGGSFHVWRKRTNPFWRIIAHEGHVVH